MHRVGFGILCVLLLVLLGGCTEIQTMTGETDKASITSYSIVTEAYSPETEWEIFGEGFASDLLPELVNVIIPGPDEWTGARYRITGIIKNIADYDIEDVRISAKFYAANNTYLGEEYSPQLELAIGQNEDFTITCPSSNDYFEDVAQVSFFITAQRKYE